MQAQQLTVVLRCIRTGRASVSPIVSLLDTSGAFPRFGSLAPRETRPRPHFALRGSSSNFIAAIGSTAGGAVSAAPSSPSAADDYYKLVPVEQLLLGAVHASPSLNPALDVTMAAMADPGVRSPAPSEGTALSIGSVRTSTAEPAAFKTVTVPATVPVSLSLPELAPAAAAANPAPAPAHASARASAPALESTPAPAPPSAPTPPPALSATAAAAAAAVVAAASPKLNADGWPISDSGAPLEPEPWQCCGNDCVNCVWIQYEEQVNKFKDAKKAGAEKTKVGGAT